MDFELLLLDRLAGGRLLHGRLFADEKQEEEEAAMVVAGGSGAAAAGVELRGDARHAAVQGEAAGERRLQQLLRVLAP
uniref:Uncharacterized protein n=1 Tax=Oryza meridionalis TaxID=40149 RepID=A0A0E0CLP1_9ORYZ